MFLVTRFVWTCANDMDRMIFSRYEASSRWKGIRGRSDAGYSFTRELSSILFSFGPGRVDEVDARKGDGGAVAALLWGMVGRQESLLGSRAGYRLFGCPSAH